MNEYVINVSIMDPKTGESLTVVKRSKIVPGDNIINIVLRRDLEKADPQGDLESRLGFPHMIYVG